MKRSALIFCFAMLVLCGCITTPVAHAQLSSIDVFGTSRLDGAAAKSQYGAAFEDLASALDSDFAKFAHMKAELENAIKKTYGFAFVELSFIRYFSPDSKNLTVDVVEPLDVGERMPFFKEPQGQYQDPEGLIALWSEYEKIGFDLLSRGEVKPSTSCRG